MKALRMINANKFAGIFLTFVVMLLACNGHGLADAAAHNNRKASCNITDVPQQLRQYSLTASSITGDITISSRKIIFGNGETYLIDFLSDNSNVTGVTGDVYRIKKITSHSKLMRHLCGSAGPITYVEIDSAIYGRNSPGCSVQLYNDKKPPLSRPFICAGFNYTFPEDRYNQ